MLVNYNIRGATQSYLPKSIPITGPRTFSSAESELHRMNEEVTGDFRYAAERSVDGVARGSYQQC